MAERGFTENTIKHRKGAACSAPFYAEACVLPRVYYRYITCVLRGKI